MNDRGFQALQEMASHLLLTEKEKEDAVRKYRDPDFLPNLSAVARGKGAAKKSLQTLNVKEGKIEW